MAFGLSLHLTFHGLGPVPASVDACERPYWLSRAGFESLLDRAGASCAAAGVRFEVHFDDGNGSDLDIALPALAARGLTATFHVLAGRIDKPGALSAAALRELAAAGMTIGSHGFDHVDWRKLDDGALKRELVDARRLIEDAVGAPVEMAALPFGAFDRRVIEAVRQAGFAAVGSSAGGLAVAGAFLVPRTSPRADWDIPARIAGMTSLRAKLEAWPRRLRRRAKWGG